MTFYYLAGWQTIIGMLVKFNFFKHFYYIYLLCVHKCVHMPPLYTDIREQPLGAGSPSLRLNSDCQAWQQAPLSAETSCWPAEFKLNPRKLWRLIFQMFRDYLRAVFCQWHPIFLSHPNRFSKWWFLCSHFYFSFFYMPNPWGLTCNLLYVLTPLALCPATVFYTLLSD